MLDFKSFYLLSILNRFHGERSWSAVYHLLKGKRTSQTIQDGFLFRVHYYFGTMTALSRDELLSAIKWFEAKELIKTINAEHYILTPKGCNELEVISQQYVIPTGLNGWFYGRQGKLFWSRLSLLVQALSHLSRNVRKYYPVIKDETALHWVKRFLLSGSLRKNELVDAVRTELESVCQLLSDLEADVLLQRLSGYQCYGLTLSQMSERAGRSQEEVHLLLQSGLHRMVGIVMERDDFSILKQLLEGTETNGLTTSAHKTLTLLKNGLSIEEIAFRRRLKPSTIQDHIVEAAFSNPYFSIAPFVTPDEHQAIAQALAQAKTRKLSAIKTLCPDHIDYFQIRLVLAREGEQ
jgi:uncharacterized protein YpbB